MTLRGRGGDGPLGVVVRRLRLRQRRLRGPLRRERHVHPRSRRGRRRPRQLLLAAGHRPLAARRAAGAPPSTTPGAPPTACSRRTGPRRSTSATCPLRNDGHGGFVDVSGSVGLDLDQDGRSFAVLDFDGDGDADLVLMAARSSPQLRLFRNDFGDKNASLARAPDRDAGAIATRSGPASPSMTELSRCDQDRAGGLRVHLAALEGAALRPRPERGAPSRSRSAGRAARCRPSRTCRSTTASSSEEGNDAPRQRALRARPSALAPAIAPAAREPATRRPHRRGRGSIGRSPRPTSCFATSPGRSARSSAWRGKPALLLFWSLGAPPSRASPRGAGAPARRRSPPPASPCSRSPSTRRAGGEGPRGGRGHRPPGGHRRRRDGRDVLASCSRYLFDRREDLRLPTLLLLDGQGEVVKVYRDVVDAGTVLGGHSEDRRLARRAARAGRCPSPGTFATPPARAQRLPVQPGARRAGLRARRRSRGSSASPGSTRAPSRSTTSAPST